MLELVEQIPLVQSPREVKPQKTKLKGTFNLKEQMRMDTGNWKGFNTIGMSFAQRKFLGYRCKYEYDAKVLLLYSPKKIVLVTYTLESMGKSTFAHLLENHRKTSDETIDDPNRPGKDETGATTKEKP